MDTTVQCRLSTSSTSINVGILVTCILDVGIQEGTGVGRSGLISSATILSTILTQERKVHGLVNSDASNFDDALTGLQSSTLNVTVNQTVVVYIPNQRIVLAWV